MFSWIRERSSRGGVVGVVQQQDHGADHSTPFIVEVKECTLL